MQKFMEWIEEQLINSRYKDYDICRGEYFAFIKVKEYLLKHPLSIPCSENFNDNHDWLTCPACAKEFCRAESTHHEK